MSATFLIAAAHGPVSLMAARSYADQVQALLQPMFDKAGLPPKRVQELHWFAASEEYWFTAMAQSMGFAADLPHFHWPAVPLLSHASLQSVTRAIDSGERDLVLLGQQSGEQAAALLLGSPTAAGRYNLATRAQLSLRMAVNRRPDGLLNAAVRAAARAERDPADIRYIASTVPLQPAELKTAFPNAQTLAPAGDFFLLDTLVRALEDAFETHGLLLSAGPHGSGLATWVERN